MSDFVDIAWLHERLVSLTALTAPQAGELIREAMANGDLSAVAPHATCRPEDSARYHSDEDFSEEDRVIPKSYWNAFQTDWDERRPYFRFFHQRRVWLVPNLNVPRAAAIAFIQANDPVRQPPPPAVEVPTKARPIGTKGPGGAPAKVDWEKCLIEAARWMYENGCPPHQADLVRHIADWLGPDAPGDTQLKQHLAPLYRAFRGADRER